MADAKETMRYLTKEYEIAPAGTREEIDAAAALARVFHQHGLETMQKSFNYTWHGNLGLAALCILAAVFSVLGVLLSGMVSLVMFLLVAVCGVLYLLDTRFGIKTYSRLGFKGASQNVVARHPAAVAAPAGQKVRPVVVVAHYDTPRSDLLSKPAIAWVKPYLPRVMDIAIIVDVVCLFVQLIPFLAGIHAFCAALAVVASAALVAWAVCTLLHQFVLSYTLGANNNKSGVAGVLGVLDRIRPCPDGMPFGPDDEVRDDYAEQGDDAADAYEAEGVSEPAARAARSERVSRSERPARGESRRAAVCELDPDDSHVVMRARRPRDARVEAEPEKAAADPAVRHGLTVLRSMGILPESCQIEYVAAEAPNVHHASRPNVATAAAEAQEGRTVAFAPADADQTQVVALDPEAEKDAEADAMFASIVRENRLSGDLEPARQTAAAETSLLSPLTSPASTITSTDEPDTELRGTANAPRDVAMHSAAVSAQFVMDEPNSFTASVIQDPTWGTSSFKPVAAAPRFLADLPDPAVAAVDPYGVSNIQTVGDYNPDDFSSMDFETGTHQTVTPNMLEQAYRQDLAGFSTDLGESKRSRKAKKLRQKGRISARAADMQQQMQEQSFNDWLGLEEGYDAKKNGAQIGSWDNFADDDSAQGQGNPNRWKGGAAPRRTRRPSVEGEEAARARRAAMRLGDRDLTAHEVWFLLTGAGEAGNAGIRDFISTYRDQLNGAYFINLECLGAGRQSLVVEERADHSSIKADRRLVNIFGQASVDINRPLALARMPWRSSDASVALDCGMRAVTLCGVDRGVPANAQWTGDSPEKLDAEAIEDAVDMVVEVIRNA